VGPVTGKLVALVAKIKLFCLVTAANPTVFKQFALFVTASLAVFRSKIVQHQYKIRIFFKNWFIQQGFKPLGIGREISQGFLELQTGPADISIDMGKAFFAAQTTGGDRILNRFDDHFWSPFF
jgi:hypothetical protein